MSRRVTWRTGLGVLLGCSAFARSATAQQHVMPDSSAMHGMATGPLGLSTDRMGSGTTWIPDAVPLPMHHTMAGKWEVMAHGTAFAQYNKQGGDREGVIHRERTTGMDPYKARFASDSEARDLAGALKGADVFVGLSVAGAVTG